MKGEDKRKKYIRLLLVSLLLASLASVKLWAEDETRLHIYVICFIFVFIGMSTGMMIFIA